MADAIAGVDEFELVLALSGGGVIEEEPLVGEGLAGLEVEGAAIVAGEGVGQGEAGGFEMALQADLFAALGGEAGGVDDGLAHGGGGGAGAGEFDVAETGAVAALTVDAVGEGIEVDGFGEGLFVAGRNARVAVVAVHAVVGDRAAEAFVVGSVVAGIHGPVAALVGVPAEGELDEGVAGRTVEVGAGVMAGAEDEVDLLFDLVGGAAVGAELVAALEELAAALEHGEVALGGGVVVRFGPVGEGVFDGGGGERARHAGVLVGLRVGGMAGGAGRGRGVGSRCGRGLGSGVEGGGEGGGEESEGEQLAPFHDAARRKSAT